MNADNVLFQHYSDFPMDQWRWPNFTPLEMSCRGTGQLMVDFASMDALQALRDLLGEPIYINSAFRSEFWNKKVGGAEQSQHLKAKAYDCRMKNHDTHKFEAAARQCGFRAFGYYIDGGFMHIDTRDRPAKWGKPFPRLSAEPEPHAVLAAGKPEAAETANSPDAPYTDRRGRQRFLPRG